MRVTVGRRGLAEGQVEVQIRRGREARQVPLEGAPGAIARIWQAIDEQGNLRPPVPLQEAQWLLDDIGTWATALRAGRAAVATAAAAAP